MAFTSLRDLTGLLSGDGLRAQFLRYALTGVVITALQAAVFWGLAGPLKFNPQLANFASYLVAVASGYVLHGRFSFGGENKPKRSFGQAMRFVGVSLLSLGLNAIWVWLCITRSGLPVWTPLPLMSVVTPALVFVLNRYWVFR